MHVFDRKRALWTCETMRAACVGPAAARTSDVHLAPHTHPDTKPSDKSNSCSPRGYKEKGIELHKCAEGLKRAGCGEEGNKAVERWGPGRARTLCVCKPPLAEPRWLTGGWMWRGGGVLLPLH